MQPTLADIMTPDVKTLQSEQTLLVAWSFLRKQKVRHIPILKDRKLVGVITDRDVKKATPNNLDADQQKIWLKTLSGTPLSKVMTPDPVTAAPDLSLKGALQLFVDRKIGCLPVTRGDELVGIVTAQDIMEAMLGLL